MFKNKWQLGWQLQADVDQHPYRPDENGNCWVSLGTVTKEVIEGLHADNDNYPLMPEPQEMTFGDWQSLFRDHDPRIWYRDVYLPSQHWHVTRADKLESEGYRCEECGAVATQVHHKHYRSLWDEWRSDLEALCRNCHMRRHGLLPANDNEPPLPMKKKETA